MVLKQEQCYIDKVRGVLHSTTTSCNEYRSLLDENGVDADYKSYLSGLAKQKDVESKRKQRVEDEECDYDFYCEEESDPQYELFLGRLKERGKSYILESLEFEENGKIIEYEGSLSSDTECDQELRKKPSRQMIHVKNESSFDSQSTPSTDIEILTQRKTRSQSRREMKGNKKVSTKNTLPLSTYPRSTPALKWHSSLDRYCDPEPERLLRSGRKVILVHSENIRVVRKDDSQSTQKKEMKKLTMTRSEDEGDAVQIDPDYQMFLQSLKVSNIHSYPYIASGYKLVYESACKNGLKSTQTKEMGKPTMRNLKNKPTRSEEEDDIVILDPDYRMLCQNIKVLDNHNYAYKDSTHYVVYELKDGVSIQVKEEYNDGSDSDVEILDSTTFYKMNKNSMSESTGVSEFRQKVIAALRKPFNEEELENLWNDIEVRKRAERHLDLRHGRERSYGKQKDGKSYLDCYPVLKKKLSQMKDDKPKRLNLLRGFFVWLKQPDLFTPWTDDECLAICPESGKD